MNLIEVNNISKRFLLGSGSLKNMLLDRREADRAREFWALKDVSFTIAQGTSLGIVGHNGSGKSTMLKLLTGILDPTKGSITTRGRIGALIEVGAGFHPDLTGRENVYLNGSILGMSEREITRRFDEIVDFAGLEQFIDTPVKRYSSGMYMRLGFSIAANINPDILIVDEVLAVGDTQFQNKCMKRMKEFLAQGGTVVFVSHAMGQVAHLCERCVWLDHGQLFFHGPTQETVGRYMVLVAEREEEEFKRKHPNEWKILQEEKSQAVEPGAVVGTMAIREWPEPANAHGNDMVRLSAVRVLGVKGQAADQHDLAQPVTLEMEFCVLRSGFTLNPVFHIYNEDGVCVINTSNLHDARWGARPYPAGIYRTRCTIPANLLNDGLYRVSAIVVCDTDTVVARQDAAVSFYMRDDGSGRGNYKGGWMGVIRPLLPWSIEPMAGGKM